MQSEFKNLIYGYGQSRESKRPGLISFFKGLDLFYFFLCKAVDTYLFR